MVDPSDGISDSRAVPHATARVKANELIPKVAKLSRLILDQLIEPPPGIAAVASGVQLSNCEIRIIWVDILSFFIFQPLIQ